MAFDLSVVEFDEIYEILMENDEPMHNEDECMEYLNNSDNSNAVKWMEQIDGNADVLSDIKTIIAYYLEENGE